MDRLAIGKLLSRYAEALETAAEVAPASYSSHLDIARHLASRWLGGESIAALQAAVRIELQSYLGKELSGIEAEDVGRALGNLCEGIGVDT